MVLPATAAAVISRGELPRANPSIFTLRRSPARTTPSFSRLEARRTASSEVAAGITAFAPLASAVTIVVVARRTPMTTTPRPPRSPAPTPAGGARRVVHGDRPRARLKVAGRVFGVHPALDGVAAQPVPVHHERQRLARGDANLLLHQVEIGAHLGDRVLHLDAGVHLHEIEGPVLVEQEFDRSRANIADRFREPHGRISDVVPQCLIHGGTPRPLHQLLMAALDRAGALAPGHGATVRVAPDLDLDVARPRGGPLDVHPIPGA